MSPSISFQRSHVSAGYDRSRIPGNFTCAPVLAVCACTIVAWVCAAPITVKNPSFEILPAGGLPYGCGPGCLYSQDTIPGWINTPFAGLGLSSGQWRPGTDAGNTTYFNSLPDGLTSAYTSTGCIEQTVGATVQEGVTYTLLVDVGWRNDASPTGVPRLRVNGIYYDGTGTPVHGGWATFTTTNVGRAQDVGLPITICLNSVSNQGNFDHVRLSNSSVVAGADSAHAAPELQLEARPNPFSALTRVRFSIPRSSPLVLRIYGVTGRAVRTLLTSNALGAGPHEVLWDGRDDAGVKVSSGRYLLRIETAEGSRVERMLLVR